MELFRFRWLLPITQVSLYAGLLILGWREQFELSQRWAGWVDAPYSRAFAWALGINIPACILSLPLDVAVVLALRAVAVPTNVASASVTGACIALFWFWVGKRIDIAHARHGQITGRSGVLVGCCTIAVASLAVFVAFHRVYLIEIKWPMLDWIVVGIWALASTIRRAKASSTVPR